MNSGGLVLDDGGYSGLLDAIYAAAVDVTQWSGVIEQLSTLFEGSCAMYLHGGAGVAIHHAAGFDPAAQASYAAHFHRINPGMARIARLPARTASCGRELFGDDLLPGGALERTEFYNDWLKPQGMRDTVCYVLDNRDGSVSGITCRRAEARGLYDDAAIALWRRLMQHVQRSLDVFQRLSAAEVLRDVSVPGLSGLAIGVILADQRGACLYANAVAERLLAAGDGLSLVEGKLAVRHRDAAGRLEQLIDAAARTARQAELHPGGAVRVPRLKGPPLHVLVAALSPRARILGLPAPAAALFLHDPEAEPRMPERALRQLWNLTPAESRLVQALVAGTRIEDYAAKAGIAPATAWTLLRRVFDKTDTRRQTDLVRLIARDPVAQLLGLADP